MLAPQMRTPTCLPRRRSRRGPQAAAVAALGDTAHQQQCVEHNTRWLKWTRDALTRLGIRVLPAYGNFLCLDYSGVGDGGGVAACAAADLALRQRGLIPRTLAEYGMPAQLRITIGLEAHNRAVVDALAAGPRR